MSVSHRNDFLWSGRQDFEDGAQARRLHDLMGEKGQRALLGFACDAGVIRNKGRAGAAHAPDQIRKALTNLSATGGPSALTDLGTIQIENDALEAGQTHMSIKLDKELRQYERIVVLGGGHETAFGSYSGLKLHYPDAHIGIINLDAHLDLRKPGDSGPSSGTPFYQMREAFPKKFDYLCLGAAEESNTSALFDRARQWSVGVISDKALLRDPRAADKVIRDMIARSDIIYLTIDLDVLPFYQMPGVSAPAARGVPLATIERLIGFVLEGCDAAGKKLPLADIVELNPVYDQDNMSAKTAALIARQLLLS